VLARLALVLLTLSAVLHSADSASVSHRKLLQGTGEPPFILSPLVPINWGFFQGARLNEFAVREWVSYWVAFSSALMSLNAVELTFFGDVPTVSLAIPQFSVFGGRGWNPLTPEGVEPGAIFSELAAWLEFEFFNLGATFVGLRVSLFDRLGLEDLGLGVPSNFADLYSIPWSSNGAVQVSIIDDSLVNFLLSPTSSYSGFYGTSFSSV